MKHLDDPERLRSATAERAEQIGAIDSIRRPSDGRGPRGVDPEAAICVQDVDVQCVLQFTLIHAAGCALHRRTSRVIHRSK